MSTRTASLSVGTVIPGHNFVRNLEWILEALGPQMRPGDHVVVVDDHSTEPVRDAGRDDRTNIEIVRLTGGSPGNRSAARNAGWTRCQTDLIVFLDGDMVPGPGFLDRIRELHAREAGVVAKVERFALSRVGQLAGKQRCLEMIAGPRRWVRGGAWQTMVGADSSGWGPLERTDKWYYAASNAISVERRAVETIGGWDEGYTGWGEEDMDFAYRLYLMGTTFVFPPAERLYAVHLNHPISPHNIDTLLCNARRFVAKFPEVYPVRLPAYDACGLRRQDFWDLPDCAPPDGARRIRYANPLAAIHGSLRRWTCACSRFLPGASQGRALPYC